MRSKYSDSYMHNYFGLSTDTKPTGEDVPNASMFYEMDTGEIYMYDKENDTWLQQ